MGSLLRAVCSQCRCLLPGCWLVTLTLAGPLGSQTIQGTVTGAETHAPIGGGLIQLLGPAERVLQSTTSDEIGRFRLDSVAPGSYRIRVLRIGFRPWLSDLIALDRGQSLQLTLQSPATPVVLDEISVEVEGPCRASPEADQRLALLWDGARTGLGFAASGLTRQFEFETRVFRRHLDPYHRTTAEQQSTHRAEGTWPVTSTDPESLAILGFVQPRDTLSGPIYYGPDVTVFFSDAFLRTHCFRLVASPKRAKGLLGLGFEPVKGRKVPDIEGTLWLDRSSGALRRLEFRHTGLWAWLPQGESGGTLEFGELAEGSPIITAWTLRAPIPRTRPRPGGAPSDRRTLRYFGDRIVELDGFVEDGGEVQEVRTAAGQVLWRRPKGPGAPT
jgi:hypothetical protein